MTILWSIDELVAALAARPVGTLPQGISGVSIDTRTIQAGEAFFAIRGDRVDGHDYLTNAMRAGAGLAVVAEEKLVALGHLRFPLLVVSNVLDALERLGRAARARAKAQDRGGHRQRRQDDGQGDAAAGAFRQRQDARLARFP